MDLITKHKTLLLWTCIEIIAVIIIFIMSYLKFVGSKTTNLVAYSDCSSCDTCNGMYSLQFQSGYNQIIAYAVSANASENEYGTLLIMDAIWSSCSAFQQENFNISNDAYIVIAGIPATATYIPSASQQGSKYLVSNFSVPLGFTANSYVKEFNDDDCFQLSCYASYGTVPVTSDDINNINTYYEATINVNNFYNQKIEVFAAFSATESTITGQCMTSMTNWNNRMLSCSQQRLQILSGQSSRVLRSRS